MRNGTGISSVNDGKIAYTQEEAKEKHQGGGQEQGQAQGRTSEQEHQHVRKQGRREGQGDYPPAPPPHYLLYVSPL